MREPRDRDEATRDVDDAAQDWFLRLASGEPSAEELASFRKWRDADPRHRAAYDEIREVWNGIGALEAAWVPAAPPRPARRAVRGGAVRGVAVRGLAVLGGLAAACAVLFVAASVDVPVLLRADHRTGVGEQRTITLPDGSLAHLNTDSAIALHFSDGHRRVSLLRGEAMFEVAKDPDRPFDVSALDGRSTALGTAFVVRESGEAATVTVAEGTVRVTAPAAPETETSGSPGSSVTLTAGRRVSYRRGGPPGPVGAADLPSATAWRSGSIAIDGLPLADALAEIDRYRPGRIVLLADTARFEPVTVRASLQALDGALKALAATHGLTVIEVTHYLTIIRDPSA
ncbi:FecR family protein [Arenibaculum pallidiluteum]|uniref:FecR family protein n=1 Tax=Arenibaculum pallidiluteum TaxID=2812559 RepID=UPI001A96C78E|nr:FecR domain-containing protein [Arenibaculum pallidiluteum]